MFARISFQKKTLRTLASGFFEPSDRLLRCSWHSPRGLRRGPGPLEKNKTGVFFEGVEDRKRPLFIYYLLFLVLFFLLAFLKKCVLGMILACFFFIGFGCLSKRLVHGTLRELCVCWSNAVCCCILRFDHEYSLLGAILFVLFSFLLLLFICWYC